MISWMWLGRVVRFRVFARGVISVRRAGEGGGKGSCMVALLFLFDAPRRRMGMFVGERRESTKRLHLKSVYYRDLLERPKPAQLRFIPHGRFCRDSRQVTL